MKNITTILIALLSLFLISGCEEVIDVNLDTSAPKLVIDAAIVWDKETDGSLQTITITKTSSYYQNNSIGVSGAVVSITNSKNNVFDFIEEIPNSGKYVCKTFIPEVNESYTLKVVNEKSIYTATEKLIETPAIEYIESFKKKAVIGDKFRIEVLTYFKDKAEEKNYYLVAIKQPSKLFYEYSVLDDQITQGNTMFDFYASDELNEGEIVTIKHLGISERYANYLSILLSVSGNGGGGGPFQTPAATVKGNIINETNSKDNPLGFFRLSQLNNKLYTIPTLTLTE